VTPATPEKILHLYIKEGNFTLVWKQGATVVAESNVTKPESAAAAEVVVYPDLAKKVQEECKTHCGHQDPSDKKLDQAVLHADNRLAFKEVVAVMDAIYATQREFKLGNETKTLPTFNMTFSAN
jgi:hypothetical protein